MRTFLLATALVASSAAHAASRPEDVTIATIGLHVTKPAEWHYLTAEANAENLRQLNLNDKQLQEAVAKQASVPIVAFSKFEEPYPDLNPSLKINVRAAGNFAGREAVEILGLVVPNIQRAFNATIDQGPAATSISGLPAAYARLSYVITANGSEYPTTSEMWIVPRGSYILVIGAGTRQDESNAKRAEIHAVVEGIKIDQQH